MARTRSLNFTFQASNARDAARDAPADIITRAVYYPRYRDRHFYACAPQSGELIHARNLIAAARRSTTGGGRLLFRGDKFTPAERWGQPGQEDRL